MDSVPPAIKWYWAYSWSQMLLHWAATVFLIVIGMYPPEWTSALPPELTRILAFVVAAISFAFGATYPIVARVRNRPRAWEYHLTSILFGAGSGIMTVPCLFLLVAWFKPEVKRYYQQGPL